MYKGLLRISLSIFLAFLTLTISAQIITDSLEDAVIIANPIVPKSYKKKELNLALSTSLNTTLSDVLEDNSSTYIKSYGKGQLSSISIRGTGASQTQLYWNGFSINSPTLGQTDLSLLPTFFIDKAQINYGHSSLINGSGGLGGSIQLTNRLMFNKGLTYMVGQEISSFGNYTTLGKIGFGTQKWQHQFKGMFLTGKNDFTFKDMSQIGHPTVKQQNNEVAQVGFQYEGSFKLTEKDILKTTVYYFNSDRNLPAIIGAAESKQNQTDKNLRSVLSWKAFREKYTSDFSVSFFNENMHYTDSFSRIFSETKVNTFQSLYKTDFKLHKINVSPQVQLNYSKAVSDGFKQGVDRLEGSLLVKLNQQFTKIGYDVMLRQSFINNAVMPFVYGAGVNYGLLKKDRLTVKITGSKNFRYPTLNDLYWNPGGNINLQPENGWSSEIGFESKLTNHKLSLYGFYGVIDNWIQWQPTTGNYWIPVNLKTVENKGIEFEYGYKTQHDSASLNIGFDVGYGYTSSVNKQSTNKSDNTIDKMLIYVPMHKVSFTGHLITKVVTLSYTQVFTSKVFIDASNSIYLPYYMPAKLTLSKKVLLKKNVLDVAFTVDNLYNEPYQVVANRPLPGINYSLSVKFGLE